MRRKIFSILFAMALSVGAIGITDALATGATDYATYCQGCHGSLANSTVNGTTVAAVRTAISKYGMGSAGSLTDAQIQAILDAIHGTPAPAACTGYTYSAWSACGTNGQQTRTVTGNTPAGCTGTPSTAAVLTQACTPPPVACTGYTYSAWSACGTNGQQTRTVTANTPAGCTGTPSTAAVLTQACTPSPVACTGYTYSGWSACVNGQQTRTVAGNTPSGCTGTPSTSAVLTQACTSSPVACTSYTYSAWSACQSNSTQTRTVVSSLPAGCTGTPDPSLLTQICNYVPPVTPPPTNGTMPVPTHEQVFSYQPVGLPVVSGDPAQAEPIGVGPVATGGNTVDIKVNVGPFAGPVNVSLVVYAPALDFDDLYFMRGSELKLLSEAVDEEEQSARSGQSNHSEGDNGDGSSSQKRFSKLVVWKSNVTGVNENIYTGPVADLPSGLYTLVLVVKSPKDDDNYYRWVTHIAIP